ncbi:hypothetical protein D3C72_2253640 [compost metagenome]
MAMSSPSPVPTSESRPAEPDRLSAWLAGLSWLFVLLLIPLAMLATGLDGGFLTGRPHG